MPWRIPSNEPDLELIRKDLAAAFLSLQELDSAQDRNAVLEDVRQLLHDIHGMTGRIQDPAVWSEIHTEADKLAAALRAAESE
jgi:hypothetical protein